MKKSKKFLTLCTKYGVNPDDLPVEVLTVEQAFKLCKLNPKKLPVVTGLPLEHRKRIIADYQLTIVAQALRGGSKVNFTDDSGYKYFPVFEVKADAKRPSGFGLAFSYYCAGWRSISSVGVRLCFPNRSMAVFFGKHFLKLHKDHHLYT